VKTQHTPGPWAVSGHINRFTAGEIIKAGDEEIASVHDFNRYNRDAEREANARLIAASPKMLAALRVLLPYLPEPEDAVDPQQHAALVAARAAIAEAEGE
jgi:hypothetical protein